MKRVFAICAIAVLMAAFQNCQPNKMNTSSSDSSTKVSGELIPVTAEDPEDVTNSEDATGSVQQPAEEEDGDPVVVDNGSSPGTVSPGNSGNAPGGKKNQAENPEDPNSLAGNYVCILDGPGKSVKLGITSSGTPQGQNPIPSVLCMSRNACLNIASQAFTVKGPEFRGYCKLPHGNPHVSHITDAGLQAKIDELKKK